MNLQTGWHPRWPLSAQQGAPPPHTHTITLFVPLWCLDASGFWEQVWDVTFLGVTAWNWSPFGTEPSCCAGACHQGNEPWESQRLYWAPFWTSISSAFLLPGGPWVKFCGPAASVSFPEKWVTV